MPSIVDVLLEVEPDSLDVVRQRIQTLASKEYLSTPIFARLQNIPSLHFMSIQIFTDGHFDPLLVFENNFDGAPQAYWPGVLLQLANDLRPILACTKHAKLPAWANLFTPGNTADLQPFLEAHSCPPSAQHFGAVAYSLERIQRDRSVFEDLQQQLGVATSAYRGTPASQIQSALRTWALTRYQWLQQPENPSTNTANKTYQWSTMRPLLPWLASLLSALSILALYQSSILAWHGLPGMANLARFLAALLLDLGTLLFATLLLLIIFGIAPYKILRRLEQTDFTQDAPQLSPEQLKLFAIQEDQIVQNHLASMVMVKPGMIRGFLIRAALRLLKFGVPLVAWNGYLGSMRTIHFAHWTLVGNSGRLLFLSNFDGSWQSYLDDFVDKAAHGLTLAWGNCIGFPRTQNLIFQGAAHGTEFKAWARQSQTQSILWYSAYSTLTVNQIIRNAAIVDGLRKTSMPNKEAEEWARLL